MIHPSDTASRSQGFASDELLSRHSVPAMKEYSVYPCSAQRCLSCLLVNRHALLVISSFLKRIVSKQTAGS
jgi:hypothetical protein